MLFDRLKQRGFITIFDYLFHVRGMMCVDRKKSRDGYAAATVQSVQDWCGERSVNHG
jgi:hypothetical protein